MALKISCVYKCHNTLVIVVRLDNLLLSEAWVPMIIFCMYRKYLVLIHSEFLFTLSVHTLSFAKTCSAEEASLHEPTPT